jgi:mono/diheme cytochrome c family protein
MTKLRSIAVCLSLFPMLSFSAAPVMAQDISKYDGPALYEAFCYSCHGLKGDGDGPVADALKEKMKPLGTLAKRNGGAFPEIYVVRTIDGRADVKAHGYRHMPVWGIYFRQKNEGTNKDASTKKSIQLLVKHIESLQVK